MQLSNVTAKSTMKIKTEECHNSTTSGERQFSEKDFADLNFSDS